VEHRQVWTINGSTSCAALEGSYVGNCGQQPQWYVVEVGSQKSVCCSACLDTPGGQFEHFDWYSRGLKSETTLMA